MHTRKRLLRRGVAFEEASKQKSKHAGPSNLTSEVSVVAGKRKGKRSPPASSSQSDCGGSNSSPEREQSQRTKRQEAMDLYMKAALANKRGRSDTKRRKDSAVKEAFEGYLSITVGRMNYSDRKKKGMLDRSFTCIKVPFHKDSSHDEVLSKCIDQMWKEAPEGQCYLADGSGFKITGEDYKVTLKGQVTSVPWTLTTYMDASGLKWPSRVRLYCVNMSACDGGESEGKSTLCVEDQTSSTSPTEAKDGSPPQTSSHVHNTAVDKPPNGYFVVDFVEKICSEYSDKVSFRSGLSQSAILSTRLMEDPDCMHEVEDTLLTNALYCIFPENPLQYGFYLNSIGNEKDGMYEFIDDLDCDTGMVTYKGVTEGSCSKVWSGCYASKCDRMVIMACPAINGYHSVATYSWQRNGNPIVGEETPLLFCAEIGVFRCYVNAGSNTTLTSPEFVVSECSGALSVHLCGGEEETLDIKDKPLSSPEKVASMCTTCSVAKYYNKAELAEVKSSLINMEELRIIEEVGQGAFGRVYRAVWRGSVVAAKEIPTAGNHKLLQNELSVYRSLNHPNLLHLLGTISRPNSMVLVTNFVRGKTLHSLIFDSKDHTELNYQEKLVIAQQLCQGVVFMHNACPPVAHLDLKPENVLVEDHTLHVFIGDFGLGKVMTTTRVFGTATKLAGTPGFQSPEQLMGENVTVSSDVYSLGAILTELFGGKPIWENLSSYAIMCQVTVKETVPKIDHLPPSIQAIVRRCLCPAQRRATAAAVLSLLCELP